MIWLITMKAKYLLKNLTGAIALTGGIALIGIPTLAQSFYFFPSSYFYRSAFPYESEDNPNVAELLTANKDFKTVSSLLKNAKLAENLSEKEVTFFAPTNEAFKALPVATQQKLSNPDKLAQLLKYHIVEGKITDENIKTQKIATLLGSPVNIVGVPLQNKQVQIKLNQATASEPLPATNGVVIPIDSVLLPPNF
ncbi:fasciclin domain protein [Stanieria sp. NIES-3757]|nr:fasciclin domain protein [Stanieria sp. NIES-3757]